MATSSRTEATRARRAFVWIAVTAALLAALLTGAWFFLADRLDREVRAFTQVQASRGLSIVCANQNVFGYPFRLGLRCDRIDVVLPGERAEIGAGALQTAGQIYDPTRLIAELDAPLRLTAPGGRSLDVGWTLLQASAHVWTAGLDRLSLVVEAPEVALALPGTSRQPTVRSAHLEVHARRNGASLDLALDDRRVALLQPALSAAPVFDVWADLTIDGAADLLAIGTLSRTPRQSLAGKAGTVRMLRVGFTADAAGAAPASAQGAAGTTGIEISGPFRIEADGLISGEFDIAIGQPEVIADLVTTLVPEISGIAGTIASSIGFAGTTVNGRTVIRVTVSQGEAALGFIRLGAIPPLP